MTERIDQLPARRSVSWAEPIMKNWEYVEDPRPRKPAIIGSHSIPPPKTTEDGRSTNGRRTFHGIDEIDVFPSQTKSSTTTTTRRRSSSRATSNTLQWTRNRGCGICRKEYGDDCGHRKEGAEVDQGEKERKEVEDELLGLVKEWIDPLLDLTMDTPRKITKQMLELRMCIEKALKTDELTGGDEQMLKEAIDRVKAETANDERI